jgi:putative hydrolase of the HAD superfamily
MRIRAVLFDLDDTLVVEEAAVEAAFTAACERACGADAEAMKEAVRRRSRELWRASPTITYCRAIGISSWEGLWGSFAGGDPNLKALREWVPSYRRDAWAAALEEQGLCDHDLADDLAAAFQREMRSRRVAFPDVEPALDDLSASRRLAVLTNGAPDLQREKMEGAGLDRYFEAVVISGDLGFGKPDPRIFAVALDALGASAGEAAMVGDSINRDVRAAQRAGLRGVWLNRFGRDPGEGLEPDAVIAGLGELRGAIE